MTLLLSLFVLFLAVIALVGVHEFGHYWVAKRLGVGIREFAIGFGPKVYARRSVKTGILYCLKLFPLGGYVKLVDSREGLLDESERAVSLDHQPVWKRLLIILAGPMMNFIFAAMAFWAMSTIGYLAVKPMIKEILPGSIAEQAGLKPGMQILKIDGKGTADWTAIYLPLVGHIGNQDTLQVTAELSGKIHDEVLNLRHWKINPLKPDLLLSLGIKAERPSDKNSALIFERQTHPLISIKEAWRMMKEFLWLNTVVIIKLFTGKISLESLAGPLSLFQGALLSFKAGVSAFLGFLAFVSIAVGYVNLLPIPGLDGTQIIYLFLEKIRGQPISIAVQVLAYRLGLIILSVLLIQVTMNDLIRYYSP